MTEPYTQQSIPNEERERFAHYIREHFEVFDTQYVRRGFENQGRAVFLDPFAGDLLEPAKDALLENRPFSAVRIGDGEANILAFGVYAGTPNLDRHAFAASIASQQDSFQVNEVWMLVLRELMKHAILSADIVGVLGLWRQPWQERSFDARFVIDSFHRDPRGIPGHIRGIDLMLRWAAAGRFKSKFIAPAHLYFSVLGHLDELVRLTDKVICITDRQRVIEPLRQRYGHCQFDSIAVARRHGPNRGAGTQPDFLAEVEAELPADMSGSLCLIGAGVWAEIYCTLAKERGAVAIDVGSGFDLLAGVSSRPIHNQAPMALIAGFDITSG